MKNNKIKLNADEYLFRKNNIGKMRKTHELGMTENCNRQ
tara:strand:+ start:2240 stop:2356 length:117 start_codon:yes stop_codon:yes gene_type:complete